MNEYELMLVLAKGSAAVSFVLETTPERLRNKEAVEGLRKELSIPVQAIRTQQRALPPLRNESE